MLNTIIISENIGGQALESWAIENYMGYRMITGEDLMKKFEEQVHTLNMRLELDRIVSISKEDDVFIIRTISENTLKARALILSAGQPPEKTWCCKRGTVSRTRPFHLFHMRWSVIQGKTGGCGGWRQFSAPDCC